MKAIEFPEQSIVIAKDQPEYLPLPAHVTTDSPQGEVIFCWRLNWRERVAVLFGGILWHSVWTFKRSLQPQRLSVEKPDMT